MLEDERVNASGLATSNQAVTRDIAAVPSFSFVIHRNAKAPCSGLGETQIGGEVMRLVPRIMAGITLPLQCKAALYLRLPLQWLGGCLMELYKNKGVQSDIGNYRDITLADLDGKDLGAFVRAATIGAVRLLG